MGNNKNRRVIFNCDYCGNSSSDRPSHYKRKVRHFCSQKCYSKFRAEKLPKEEQNRFGSGLPESERSKRANARSYINHYLRDNKIQRPVCEICGDKSEAHHDDYNKPLDVKWLCFKHHRLYHKMGNSIYENPELLKQ